MFFVDSSTDRISIGTAGASPATTVHIKETAPTLRIQRSSNANDSTIDFAGQAGAVGAVMHLSNSNDLVFKTHDGSNPDEMFRIGSYSSVLNRQIIFLSGSGMESGAMQPKEATDIAFFVSGAIGSKATAVKGAAVFGGDVAVSGAFYLEEITDPGTLDDGTVALYAKDDSGATKIFYKHGSTVVGPLGTGGGGAVASVANGADNRIATFSSSDALNGEANLTFDGSTLTLTGDASLNGAITINEDGADKDFRIESVGEDEALFIDAGANTLYINKGETDFTTIIGSDNDEAIRVGSAGVVFNEDGHDTNDFRIETDDIDNAVFVDASTNQILFGASSTPSDTFHFVSGNINGIMHGGKVSAFGGDTIVSGVLGGGSNGLHIGGGAFGEPVSIGAAYNYSNARADIGDDATIILSGNVNGAFSEGGYYGVTAINADVMLSGNLVGTYGDHFSELRMIGSPIVTSPYWGAGQQPGSDVAVFFSGSAGSMNANDSAGVVVVGGDMFVTGGLTIGTVPQAAANPTPNMDFSVNTSNYAGRLFVDGSEDHVVIGRFGDQGTSTSIGEDTLFHVSGTVDPMDGSGAGSNSVTVLAGDVVLSGALVGTRPGSGGDQVLGLKAGSNGFGTFQAFAGGVRFESFSQIGGPEGSDIYLSVSGVLGSAKQPQTYGSAVFGGDMVVSGGIYTEMGIETTKDFSLGTQFQLPMAGMSTGENLVFSPGANDTLTAGKLYFLHTDGTWNETDANDVADGAGSMLGVGRGGGSQTMGVLKRGYVRIPPSLYNGTFVTGSAVYVSDDATGEWDFTAPAGSGDYVRVVGYGVEALHGGTSDIVVWFDPSSTFLEIS
tara:strand:- start:381 stop:2897 length:2517 start_codon:yes stop_codon:yes gene_type:complete